MVLGLWRKGQARQMLWAGEADEHTVFDLASLTKPLCTALLCLELVTSGRLPWETTLGEIYGDPVEPAKRTVSIYQLLTHSAGFEAYQPFYTALQKQPRTMRHGLLKAMLMNQSLARPPGSAAVYSDLGYLLLGLIVEEAAGQSLDAALSALWQRLGVQGPVFALTRASLPWDLSRVAPCGPLEDRPVVHGQVEDENAFALGGVAGHAGLLGTVSQVGAVMSLVAESAISGGAWPAEEARRLFQLDQSTPGSGRTPGFDTPSGEGSAAGTNAPQGVVGHLGFTGTSVWWHPATNSGVVLLTNRVALGRDNEKIKDIRPLVHEMAWQALGF